MCAICGDSGESRGRWWSPDDGWRWGALCDACAEDVLAARPKPDDYAYDKAGDLDADTYIYDTQ